MAPTILLVDYGMGNIGSVVNALEQLDVPCRVSGDPRSLASADGIILPGVGAFRAAMENLRRAGWHEALSEQVLSRKKPFLGICLGMQLLAEDSTELGESEGLGWIRGHVVRIDPRPTLPVPHVGWNTVERRGNETPIWDRIPEGSHFYFDHSYQFQCDPKAVIATCDYGGEIVAAIRWENILAAQFHPEKSQRNGLKFLRNFVRSVSGG